LRCVALRCIALQREHHSESSLTSECRCCHGGATVACGAVWRMRPSIDPVHVVWRGHGAVAALERGASTLVERIARAHRRRSHALAPSSRAEMRQVCRHGEGLAGGRYREPGSADRAGSAVVLVVHRALRAQAAGHRHHQPQCSWAHMCTARQARCTLVLTHLHTSTRQVYSCSACHNRTLKCQWITCKDGMARGGIGYAISTSSWHPRAYSGGSDADEGDAQVPVDHVQGRHGPRRHRVCNLYLELAPESALWWF